MSEQIHEIEVPKEDEQAWDEAALGRLACILGLDGLPAGAILKIVPVNTVIQPKEPQSQIPLPKNNV